MDRPDKSARSERSRADAPALPTIGGFLKIRNEVLRGNLLRVLANLRAYCDEIFVCDDASDDNPLPALLAAGVPRRNILRFDRADWADERARKQALLDGILARPDRPDWLIWLDADETLDRTGTAQVRNYLSQISRDVDSVRLAQTDLAYSTARFFGQRQMYARLWRCRDGMKFDNSRGLHGAQTPASNLGIDGPYSVLHYAFATRTNLAVRAWIGRGLGGNSRGAQLVELSPDATLSSAERCAVAPEWVARARAVRPEYGVVLEASRALREDAEALARESAPGWICIVPCTEEDAAAARALQEADPRFVPFLGGTVAGTLAVGREFVRNWIVWDRTLTRRTSPARVSVLIPAFGAARWLQQAVESAACQAVPGKTVEIIVGVDGCAETLAAARRVASRVRACEVRVVSSPTNAGLFLMRNSLVDCATGDALAFIDADDVLEPGALARWLTLLDHGAAIAQVRVAEADENLKVRSNSEAGPRDGVIALRRATFDLLGGFRPWICTADTELLDRARAAGMKFATTAEVGYRRRNHPDQHTRWAWTRPVREAENAIRAALPRATGPIPRATIPLRQAASWGAAVVPKPKILLLSDVRGWAFDTNLRALATYLPRFDYDFWYVAEGSPRVGPEHDLVYVAYHRWPEVTNGTIPLQRAVGSLRSQWFDPSTRAAPSDADVELVNRFRAFHVVRRDCYDGLRARCPRLEYLTNPVDTRRFTMGARHDRGQVVAAWNGNATHEDGRGVRIKGFYDFVQPACARADVPLVYAEYATKRQPPDDMPAFYQQANVTVCASLYEGASNSVMEAMASGHALVATDVGNHRELRDTQLREYGDTGIVLVDRSVDAIAAALAALKHNPARVAVMGTINRDEILARWSWEVWADRYENFLLRSLA